MSVPNLAKMSLQPRSDFKDQSDPNFLHECATNKKALLRLSPALNGDTAIGVRCNEAPFGN